MPPGLHFSTIHRELNEALASAARDGETLMEMTVTEHDTRSPSVTLRAQSLARWEDEGGAQPPSSAHPDEPDAPPLTNAELVQLRVRVIALENIVIALLAGGGQQQDELVRDMAALIAPRTGAIQHSLTVHAAEMMTGFVHRAEHFRAHPTA